MKKSVCLIIVAGALSLVMGCATIQGTKEPKVARIGFLAGLTGFGSEGLVLGWQGAQLAEEWINEQGGVTVGGQTYMIELVSADTGGNPETTKAAAARLIRDESLNLIAGGVMPHIISSATTVTEEAGVILVPWYNCASPMELGPDTPNTFLSHIGSVGGAIAGFSFLKEAYPDAKTVTIIIPNDGSIPFLGPIVARQAKAEGYEVLGEVIGWDIDTVDFTSVISEALEREPDSMALINGWPAAVGSMLKAARERGFGGPVFSPFHPGPDVREIAGIEASTHYFTVAFPFEGSDVPPLVSEISQRAKAEYGFVHYYHIGGFNAVYVLLKVIEAAQSIDPDDIRETWEKMDSIETVYGSGRMGGKSTYGIKHAVNHSAAIQTMMNGEVEHVKWIDVYVP